jgi:F-type H+-transporting ATPase subunit delta
MRSPGAGRRYAEAAFGLAQQAGTVEAWQRDLAIAAGLAGFERIGLAADSPAVPFEERRAMIERLLGSLISAQACNLVLLLARRGRFEILPDVSAEYDALVRKSRGIVAATVTTPAPLSDATLARVRARVEELAGANVELATAVDPALLGGLTVRIGDILIDASVQSRLDRLRAQLAQGTN